MKLDQKEKLFIEFIQETFKAREKNNGRVYFYIDKQNQSGYYFFKNLKISLYGIGTDTYFINIKHEDNGSVLVNRDFPITKESGEFLLSKIVHGLNKQNANVNFSHEEYNVIKNILTGNSTIEISTQEDLPAFNFKHNNSEYRVFFSNVSKLQDQQLSCSSILEFNVLKSGASLGNKRELIECFFSLKELVESKENNLLHNFIENFIPEKYMNNESYLDQILNGFPENVVAGEVENIIFDLNVGKIDKKSIKKIKI